MSYDFFIFSLIYLKTTLSKTMMQFSTRISRQTFLSLRWQQQQLQLFRYMSSSHIPEPTWSIKDLDLTSKKPRLPPEELKRLSRLALIDIDSIAGDKKGLEQDLSNMLHMIDQVTYASNTEEGEDDDETSRAKAAEIYDIVRGVTSAPLRTSIEDDPLQGKDQEQAENVWKKLLQPKTTRKGGRHEYFAIKTKDG